LAVEKIKISYEVAGKKELAAINEELLQMIKKNGLLQKEIEDTIEKFKNQGKQADGLSGTLKKTANILAGVFAADKIIDFGKEVLKIRGEMQRFEAVLTNTLGSNSAAQKALKEIVKFASETPFSVSQLTDSFIKLANRGIIATNEQMRKMGDLSAALGKDFGILNEAILDVNNTERWNELGIKVKTTGDTMTGTFKGVTVEVDRTEKGALKMVETFGSFKGVAGGMAAISETLEGRISNLGDSYETLLNSIGTRTEGIFAGAIGALGDLINTTNEWVSIPASKAIASEQGELNALVQAIINTNDEERVRSGLIQELNTRFPDFLENIEDENVTNDLLRTTLEKVNDEYRKKIILQLSEEKVTEIIKGQNAAILKRIELEQKLAEEREKKNKDLIAGFDAFVSAADPIRDLQRKISELDEELLKAQESQNALFKEFGIDPEADAKKLADKKKNDDADKEAKQKNDDADKEAKKVAAAIALEAVKEDKKRELDAIKEIEKSAKEQEKQDIEADNEFFNETTNAKIEKLLEQEEEKQEMRDFAYENDQERLNITANDEEKTALDIVESKKKAAAAQEQIALGLFQSLGAIAAEGSSLSKAAALAEIVYGTSKGFINGLEIAQKGAAGTGPLAPFTFPLFFAGQIAAVIGAASQAKSVLATQAPLPAPKFEHGGRVGGNLHSRGGTMIEAEINEHVMSRRATAKYGHHFFDSLNSLELRPDILNGMSGGSSPIIINSDNKELINEYRNRPITNISISENGITKRTQRNNNIIQKKLLRYKS
jgi:hypothetical protein